MTLLLSLKSELIKSKRTASLYLTLITAAITPAIILLEVASDGISKEHSKDTFNALFQEGFRNNGFVIFPMFIILICTLLPQMEFKNNTWKQVLASPQSKLSVFFAKFINIHLLIILFLVAHNIFMLIATVAMHFMTPAFNILNQPLNVYNIFTNNLNIYVTLLAIGALQFWVSLRFKNFIFPIAVGFAMWFMAAIMELEYHWNLGNYFPYSFHLFSIFDNRKPQLPTVQVTSVIYATVFLVLGFIDFKLMSRKS
jgi:hypothetical protein